MKFDILIIGGGFSGTISAIQLLRHSNSLSIGVIDPASLPGRGVAYTSPHRFHLLNVPVGEMSALPDVPNHFLEWCRVHFDASLKERSFPPRAVYGEYIGDLLEKTLAERGRDRFQWLQNRALSVHPRGACIAVQTSHGPEIVARTVVLATGNFPPANPHARGLRPTNQYYFQYPWSPEVLENLPGAGNIVLLGSGLTSVDLIMALKSKGFRGTIEVISRKGLFPHARRHIRPIEPWPMFWNKRAPRTVRGLLGLIRQQTRKAAEKGIDWRSVIDCLRPVTQQIWEYLPVGEQKRFLRHVRPYWDVHRHRLAPEIADLLADMQAEGQVRLHTGVLSAVYRWRAGAQIRYWDRISGSEKKIRAARIINCMGSESDCRRIDDSLIISLFAQGLARPDALFLGLDVDQHGRLLNHNGQATQMLYAIGPPCKGCFWETTTVFDIRRQAVELATHLTNQFQKSREKKSA